MYQAEVSIEKHGSGNFTVFDVSTGDETPSLRRLILRDGYGKLYEYEFDFSNRVDISISKDSIFSLDYTAEVSSPQLGSIYERREVFVITDFVDKYLLDATSSLYCNSEPCSPNKDKVEELSKLLIALQSIDSLIESCNPQDAQCLLNYVRDSWPSRNSTNCGCGC